MGGGLTRRIENSRPTTERVPDTLLPNEVTADGLQWCSWFAGQTTKSPQKLELHLATRAQFPFMSVGCNTQQNNVTPPPRG